MGLGTDGPASNNNLDLFEEMDTAAKVHKLVRSDPTVMPAKEVFRMATRGGAKALGLDALVGSLEAGKRADVVLIDVRQPELTPMYDVYSHLVYAIKGAHVKTVLVDGRVILRDRKMTHSRRGRGHGEGSRDSEADPGELEMRAALLSLVDPRARLRDERRTTRWKMAEPLSDAKLERDIFRALDAAAEAGTYPPLSKFQVRAATVVEDQVVVGGNTEYEVPEAIHGESSLVNHAISLFGPETTREKVRFIAYYAERCGDSLSCGDCRDYQVATLDVERLLAVCGESSTGLVHVRRFRDALVSEERISRGGRHGDSTLARGARSSRRRSDTGARRRGRSVHLERASRRAPPPSPTRGPSTAPPESTTRPFTTGIPSEACCSRRRRKRTTSSKPSSSWERRAPGRG